MKNKNIVLPLILSLIIALDLVAYNLHYYYYITRDLVELGVSNEELIKRLDLFYELAAVQLALFTMWGIAGAGFLLTEV